MIATLQRSLASISTQQNIYLLTVNICQSDILPNTFAESAHQIFAESGPGLCLASISTLQNIYLLTVNQIIGPGTFVNISLHYLMGIKQIWVKCWCGG